jgi:hypothetical protein
MPLRGQHLIRLARVEVDKRAVDAGGTLGCKKRKHLGDFLRCGGGREILGAIEFLGAGERNAPRTRALATMPSAL